jgi:hypothetical protein
MSPVPRRTPPEVEAIDDDDLSAPPSAVRPLMPGYAVVSLAVTVQRLRMMPLDSRLAYLLSLVDGQCTVETIVDASGMDRDEALGLLADLLQLGAIELRGS